MSEHAHHHSIEVPRGALIAAGSLILFTLAVVAAFRLTGQDPTAMIVEAERPVAARELRFADGEDGSVIVYEIRNGVDDRVVHVVPSAEGGFIRGVLRSMARARRAAGVGPDRTFLLVQRSDGGLLLEDPATEQRIELQAFGPTNVEAFRVLLTGDGARP